MLTIYNDDLYDFIDNNKSDLISAIKDDDGTPDNATIINYASDWIAADYDYLCDDVSRFDEITQAQKIYIDASLGLWYGRRKASATFKTLYEAIRKCFLDSNKLYFKNKNTTLTLEASHHDGVNVYKFYKIIKGKKYAIKYGDIMRI